MKKKVLFFIIVFALLATLFNITVVADEANTSLEDTVSDCQILATMDVQYAESELKNYLEDSGVSTDPGDELVAVSIDDGTEDGLTVLQVVQDEGDERVVCSLYNLDSNGDQIDAPIEVAPPGARYVSSISWVPNNAWGNGAITITVYARYEVNSIGTDDPLINRYFIDPKGIDVVYSYRNSTNRPHVDSIIAEMSLEGIRCNSRYVPVEYDYAATICTVSVNSPYANTYYYGTGSLPAGVIVEYQNNSAQCHLYVILRASVGGQEDGATRTVIPVL